MNLLELINKNDRHVIVQMLDSSTGEYVLYENPKSLFKKIAHKGGTTTFEYPDSLLKKLAKVKNKITNLWPNNRKEITRGIVLSSGMRIVVKQAGKYWPNFSEGKGVFYFRSDRTKQEIKLVIGWNSNSDNTLRNKKEITINDVLVNVEFPPSPNDINCNLVIEVPAQGDVSLFFGVHKLLDRSKLIALCSGEGVEIGPGPKPQIFPDNNTSVKYVEQASPDQWQSLYGKNEKNPINHQFWDHYVVGNADNIPVKSSSLDFIFSSHVFEHLANPLGHLVYWFGLLKPGGIIAAIIPDRDGTKDYVFEPSTYQELINEYHNGSMEPSLYHYERWAKLRTPNQNPLDILKTGRSIHVHFYTPQTLMDIIGRVYKKLGYSEFLIESSHNHKDFFMLLRK